jgi:hypothetical protein
MDVTKLNMPCCAAFRDQVVSQGGVSEMMDVVRKSGSEWPHKDAVAAVACMIVMHEECRRDLLKVGHTATGSPTGWLSRTLLPECTAMCLGASHMAHALGTCLPCFLTYSLLLPTLINAHNW